MNLCFKSISITAFLIVSALSAYPQGVYPDSIGTNSKVGMVIEMPNAYISGILILARQNEDTINGSLINEFGVSFIDFAYDEPKNKIELLYVTKSMDKWYIRRVLKNDFRDILVLMKTGEDNRYENRKRHITYIFTPLNEASELLIQD